MPRLGLLGLLAVALLSSSCASFAISRTDLPEDPIAFVHHSPEQARDLAEWQERVKNEREPTRPGVFHLDTLPDLMGTRGGPSPERLQGFLSLLDPRTGVVERVEGAPRGAVPMDWSDDHTRLAFLRSDGRSSQAFEVRLEGGTVQPLTRGPHSHHSVSYGPGGRVTAVRTERVSGRTRARVYATSAHGARPRVISAGPMDAAAVWSPDGEWILYASGSANGRWRIFRVRPDGSERQAIARGQDPNFTPKGDWVVYSAETRDSLGSRWQLWRMRPDGSGKTRLGSGTPADERQPVVSPDGEWVAYVALEENRRTLSVRRFDGSASRAVLEHGDGFAPQW